MNTDYVIQIKTKHGRTSSYVKEENDWTQTAPNGIVRQLSAEQLLSHLLPPFAGDQPGLSVSVERKRHTKKRRTLNRRIDSSTESRPTEGSKRVDRPSVAAATFGVTSC